MHGGRDLLPGGWPFHRNRPACETVGRWFAVPTAAGRAAGTIDYQQFEPGECLDAEPVKLARSEITQVDLCPKGTLTNVRDHRTTPETFGSRSIFNDSGNAPP